MFFAFIDGMAGKPNGFYAGQIHVKEKKVSFQMAAVRTKLPFDCGLLRSVFGPEPTSEMLLK